MGENALFINILQGKTGRWIEGESAGAGLYTDEIETCKVFLFFGRKNGKRAISMIHYDGYTNVADVEQEKNWFDEVTHCYICLKPERALQGNFSELFEILSQELKNLNISYEIAKINRNCDAVIAHYRTEPSIVWFPGAKFNDCIKGLINHPQACKMYAYYKLNIMLSEIEGEIQHCVAFYKKESRQESGNFYLYKGKTYHLNLIFKLLAREVIHQQVMYDGKEFRPLATHDQSLTPFAKEIVTEFPPVIESMTHLLNLLSQSLKNKEFEKTRGLNPYHSLRDWLQEQQTTEISKAICYTRYQQHEFLPVDYKNILKRYNQTHKFCIPYFSNDKEKIQKLLSTTCMADLKSDSVESQCFLADINLSFLTCNVRKELNLDAKTMNVINSQGKKYIKDNIPGSVFVDGFFQNGRKASVIYYMLDEKLQDHPLKNGTGKSYNDHLNYANKEYVLNLAIQEQPDTIPSLSSTKFI